MVDKDITASFVDKRRATSTADRSATGHSQGSRATRPAATAANAGHYADLTAAIARLQSANAAYYTNARIRSMTGNDIFHALRQLDDAGSL